MVEDEEDDYSDEEIDAKVENILRLYSEKHCFNNSMFKRGLAMADVERMSSKGKSKKRATKATKKAVPKESGSEERFATLLYDKMKPEISKFREMAKNINATVKVAGQEFASMESRVGSIVENKIKDMIEFVMVPMVEQRLFRFKEDIIQGIESIIKNQHEDPVINSKGQPSTMPHCDNTDQPCYDTENVSSLTKKRVYFKNHYKMQPFALRIFNNSVVVICNFHIFPVTYTSIRSYEC